MEYLALVHFVRELTGIEAYPLWGLHTVFNKNATL